MEKYYNIMSCGKKITEFEVNKYSIGFFLSDLFEEFELLF